MIKKLGLCVFILCAILFTGCGTQQVDLNSMTKVVIEGYTGEGTASVSVDEDALAKIILSDRELASIDEFSIGALKGFAKYYAIIGAFDVKIDKVYDIANGDEIQITYHVDNEVAKEYGFEFLSEPMTYKVSNMKEYVMIDPFEFIEVKFNQISPNCRIEIVSKNNPYDINSYSFALVDKKEYFEKDEEVELKFIDSLEKGQKLIVDKKKYLVNGVKEFVPSLEEISDEAKEEIDKFGKDLILSYLSDKCDFFDYTDFTYEGNYYFFQKDTSKFTMQEKNYIIMVFSANLESCNDENEISGKYYFPVAVQGILEDENGEYSYAVIPTDIYDIGGVNEIKLDYERLRGYPNFEKMYKKCVLAAIGEYNCEIYGDSLEEEMENHQ